MDTGHSRFSAALLVPAGHPEACKSKTGCIQAPTAAVLAGLPVGSVSGQISDVAGGDKFTMYQ